MRLASIKLLTGEEILAEIIEFHSDDEFSSLVIKNPVKVELNNSKRKLKKDYKLSPWMVFSETIEHELAIINIVAMTAILDDEVEDEYLKFIGKKLLPEQRKELREKPLYKPSEDSVEEKLFSQEYGYLGSVKEFKEKLEEIYKLDAEEPKDL